MSAVRRELADGVLTLCLDRHERLNALDAAMADELIAELQSARSPDVGAVVLTGNGRAFCAGADTRSDLPVADLLPGASVRIEADGRPTTDGAVPMLDRANGLALALAAVDVPVLAAVNGVAAGLGTSLVLGCDLIFMARSARLVLGFSRLGLVPDGGATAALRLRLGLGPAFGMALLEDAIDGPTALALGVANRCVADADLIEETAGFARMLAEGPSQAHRLAKAGLRSGYRDQLSAVLLEESEAQLHLIRQAAATGPTPFHSQKAGYRV